MLVILDQDVIKSVKMAALEDDKPMSHVVEEAIREWLDVNKMVTDVKDTLPNPLSAPRLDRQCPVQRKLQSHQAIQSAACEEFTQA
jgi:hypothetical protein